MKIPHKVTGMTRPSAQGLASFQDSSGLAAGGLQQLAGAVTGLGGVLQQRQEQVDAFSAIKSTEEFDQNLNLAATEQRRAADPADTTIAERNAALFDNLAQDTLKKVPPSQRAKVEAQFAQKKTAFLAGSYEFQYQQQDKWFKEGVADTLTAGQLSVDKDWSDANTDAELKKFNDKVDATALSETEKQSIKKEGEFVLRSTQYKKAVLHDELNGVPAANLPDGEDLPIITRNQPGRVSKGSIAGVKPELVNRFKAVQNAFGKSVPIVSGARDKATNDAAGGAKGSEHLDGNAIDLDVSNMSIKERKRLIATASANGFTGIGVYNNSIHLDMGNRRSWGAKKPTGGYNAPPAWAAEEIQQHLSGKAVAPQGSFAKMTGDELWSRLITQESGGNQAAVSPKGARGVAQIMPDTAPDAARMAGVAWDEKLYYGTGPESAAYNEKLGKAYLNQQLKDFGGNTAQALAAYNAGPGRVKGIIAKHGKDWYQYLPTETKNYVNNIMYGGRGDAPAIDSNPQFSMIPLEQREAIYNQARIERSRMQAEEIAAAKQLHETSMNSFLQDIYKGKRGKSDIYKAWDDGEIDYADVTKLEEAHKKYQEKSDALREGLGQIGLGRPMTAGQADAVAEHFDEAGTLQGRNAEGLSGIWQRIKSTNTVAPSTQNLLTSMTADSNPANAAFAYKALSGILDSSSIAYNKLPDGLRANIELWRAQLMTGVDDLTAAKTIQGDSSQAGMQEAMTRRELGVKMFSEKEVGAAEAATKTMKAIADPWGPTNATITPQVDYQFHSWYKAMWVENFTKTGDAKMATSVTDELAKKSWTVSEVGDFQYLTLWAPERVGYKPYEGGFDWMTQQAKEQVKLRPGEKFMLSADETTKAEIANWRAGGMQPHQKINDLAKGINYITGMEIYKNTPPEPSWRVVVQGPDGIIRLADQRVSFKQTAEMDQRETEIQDFKDSEAAIAEVGRIWRNEQEAASREGREPNPEIEKMFQEETEKYFQEKERLYPGAKPMDPKDMEQSLGGGVPDMTGGTITEEQRKLIQGDPAKAKELLKELRPQYTLPKFGAGTDPLTARSATEAISSQTSIVAETKEQKAAWWELWKGNDVVPPADFDPAKKFSVFAKVNNTEQLNHIWNTLPEIPQAQRHEAVNKMLSLFPRNSLSEKSKKGFEEIVTKAVNVPIMQLGMRLMDPERIVVYEGDDNLNFRGAYTPTGDWLFFAENSPSTFVHELIHKAVMEVRPLLTADEQKYLDEDLPDVDGKSIGMTGEEALVRLFMNYELDDIEVGRGDEGDRQISYAKYHWAVGKKKGDEPRVYMLDELYNKINQLAESRNGR